MGFYCSEEDVEIRLAGKVRVTDEPDSNSGRMPRLLLRRLISEAESDVEFQLSRRYSIPFQTQDGAQFSELPQRPTKDMIRTLCELNSVIRILETDFGEGTVVDGEKYTKNIQKRFSEMIGRLLQYRDGQFGHWMYPPLPELQIAYNNIGDTGFSGKVSVTSNAPDFGPQDQINSPTESYFSERRW
jgi:hypothetical protein